MIVDRRYITWLSLVTVAVNYNLWFVPVRMAFPCHTPSAVPVWFTADIMADIIYIIDMVMFQPRLQFCKAGDIVVNTKPPNDNVCVSFLYDPNSDRSSSFVYLFLFQYDKDVIRKHYRESQKFQVQFKSLLVTVFRY